MARYLSGASLMRLQPARGDASVVRFGRSVHVVLMQRKTTVGLEREERRSNGEEGRKIGKRRARANKGNKGTRVCGV